MLRLMLLHHAKSDWPDSVDDHDRPVAKCGQRASPTMGAYMAKEGLLPDCAIVSTARRARKTWELVPAELVHNVVQHNEPRLYDASPATILQIVRQASPMPTCFCSLGTILASMSSYSNSLEMAANPIYRGCKFRQPGSSSSISTSNIGGMSASASASLCGSRPQNQLVIAPPDNNEPFVIRRSNHAIVHAICSRPVMSGGYHANRANGSVLCSCAVAPAPTHFNPTKRHYCPAGSSMECQALSLWPNQSAFLHWPISDRSLGRSDMFYHERDCSC
jgi:hypothetical protein